MAHDKVYGICENKCQVEVLPKSNVFGIDQTIVMSNPSKLASNCILDVGTNCRGVIKNYNSVKIYNVNLALQDDGTLVTLDADGNLVDINDNYNFEVVFYKENGFAENSLPSNVLKVYDFTMQKQIPVKYIMPYNFKLSNYTTAHFYFFWNGLNLCCRCEGYA